MKIYYTRPAFFVDRGLLTETQIHAISEFRKKKLTLKKYECLCGKIATQGDALISSQDRYGIDVNILLCSECGMIRANPYYDESTLDEFYGNFYRDIYDPSNSASDIYPGQIRRGESYLQLLRDLSSQYSSVIEIGCGAGGMLVPFHNDGKRCIGYDFNDQYLEYGRNRNPQINLKYGGLNQIVESEKDTFDLIVFSHVLEHIPEFNRFLQELKTLMHKHSHVLVSVPGNRCIFKREQYDFDYRWYLVNAHCWYFSQEHLEFLFEKNGFKTKFIDEGGKYNHEDVIGVFQLASHSKVVNFNFPPNLVKKNRNVIIKSKMIQLPIVATGYRVIFRGKDFYSRASARIRKIIARS